MKNAIFTILIILFLAGCGRSQQAVVVNDDSSAAEPEMKVAEAMLIALDSECIEEGGLLTNDTMYNENTKTWWIDLELEKEGCNPACVVDANTKEASINWRCTGAIPE